ncbi:hypothetical protein D8B31_15760 [Verminephrobacter eiseniae]|nr:hypothetical protein [Verminephrobacter eiseniae]MCW8186062.1 hypothetical protein [Verminephrobacter eiseniae]MCW8224906.1 hypothetical protein [Verminephrobacter eiseniae]
MRDGLFNPENEKTMPQFWQLADSSKTEAEYRADSRPKALQTLPLDSLQRIFVQYRFFTKEIARSPDLKEEIRVGYEKSKTAWDQFWANIFDAEQAKSDSAVLESPTPT